MSYTALYRKFRPDEFEDVKESVFEVEGMKKTYRQTFVTGKGQLFIIGLLLKISCDAWGKLEKESGKRILAGFILAEIFCTVVGLKSGKGLGTGTTGITC